MSTLVGRCARVEEVLLGHLRVQFLRALCAGRPGFLSRLERPWTPPSCIRCTSERIWVSPEPLRRRGFLCFRSFFTLMEKGRRCFQRGWNVSDPSDLTLSCEREAERFELGEGCWVRPTATARRQTVSPSPAYRHHSPVR